MYIQFNQPTNQPTNLKKKVRKGMKRIDLVRAGGFRAGTHLVTSENVPPIENPKDNEVVIRIKASAVNPVDWKMALYDFFLPEPLPAALGCDIAGEIVQSPGNPELLGKRVAAYLGASKISSCTTRGAFVEQVAIDADLVAEIPDGMSYPQAASIPVGALTSELLLKDLTAVTHGSCILIWGASSSVGFNCVQLAKKRGLQPIAVASGKHEQRLRDIGAAGFVDYQKENVEDKVEEMCGSSFLNAAIDCIGDQDTLTDCAELVKVLGDPAIALVVKSVSELPLESPPDVTIVGVDLGAVYDDKQTRSFIVSCLPEIMTLKPMPIRTIKGPFAAETVQEAFETSERGVSGEKVVIVWE